VTADAAVADNINSAGTDITSETVDLGAFLSDLSHTSANSKNAVSTVTPSFFINYEDIQDTNFNSWAKTDEYDNYDDGRSPLMVGVDGIGPKLQQVTPANGDSGNTFLYDVTDEVSFSLAAAHGNHQLTTDDDVIYTPGVDSATRDTNTLQSGGNDIAFDADNGGAAMTVDVDYPLFWFWNYNTTTSATGNAENTTEIADVRAVLKLRGVTTIDSSDAQAYVYAPKAVDTDQRTAAGAADTDAYPLLASFDDCTRTEGNTDAYIKATPKVSGIRQSASLNVGGAGTANYGASNPLTAAASGASDNSQIYVMNTASDVFNVDANDNVNVLTDNGLSALIVGIENYGGINWDSPDDALVIEDVFLDGVPYTLYFEIPQVVTADITNTTYKTAETDNLPVMHVYRKVSLATVDLDPSGNGDMCSPRNVQVGQLVNDEYDPDSLSFSFREQISGTPTVTWYPGSDLDEPATATNDTTNGLTTDFTGEVVTMDSTKTIASVRLGDQVEITESFIGHDAQFTVSATDFAGNSGGFTVTLRLGQGASVDENNSASPGGNVVQDVIVNIIGPLDNNKHVSAAQTGDGTAVE